ncbi:MAG: ectoine hydroxylase [Ectothiorhodospiraceae bacterium]|nr:ectoine hydroxylase [Ectothiorhodospiraceae bacterium]MCH8504164.1 ectoine hydroxylase [Ectothiorhodospiraceae bacterium]
MVDTLKDLYPSRTIKPTAMLERLDPVVYGGEYGPLSRIQLDSYRDNGFLFFPSFFSADEVAPLVSELQRLCRQPGIARQEGVITEPASEEIRSIFEVHKRSAVFHDLCRHPRILPMAEQLLGSDVYIHQSRINYKPGFEGKGFDWHSDFETWHTEDGMPYMRAVSCSIILTDNTEFNGPLMLIPGSHKYFVPCVGETPEDNFRSSLKQQRLGVPDKHSLRRLIRQGGGIQAPKGAAGSLLLFECNTLHGSNANMSPDPRSNVFFVYNSVRNAPRRPYAASKPRPGFLAEREDFTPLTSR